MKITAKVKRVHNDDPKMKAIASVLIDDCFVVLGIRIIERNDGLLIAMPSRKTSDGTFKDIAHPINQETRKMFEDAILEEYNKLEDEEE